MSVFFLQHLEAIFSWVLAASWQASVLAVLVLLLQRMLGARLNPRWRYALWLLVLVRLVLPTLPESALSLYQFAPPPPAVLVEPVTEPLFVATPLPAPQADPTPIETAYPFSFYSLLAVIWLAGAMALLLLTWQVNRRFARQVANSPGISDPDLLDLFATTKSELGLLRPIRLIENSQVQSPAIMGLFRPTLLLPAHAREKFDRRELRFIFLHELAHLKRGDVIAQALIALLQIVHWFNPVLWFAFRRMRIDREPATDALVLSRTGEAEKESYGLMLIKLLEHFNQRHSLPTLVGILEDKDQFKRRFSLIARFTRGAYGWSLLGILLIATLAMVCLTKSKSTTAIDPAKVIEAVRKGDGLALQKLIDHGADTIRLQEQDRPLLFWAKTPEIAEILIAHDADPNIRDRNGDTALAWVCRNGGDHAAAIARVLLKHGANPNATTGELLLTPIMNARDGDTVDALIEYGADLKAKSKNGYGVLNYLSSSKPSALAAVIRHGVSFDPKKDGPNMLMRACWINNFDLIKDLLDRGVDPNVAGVWWTSPTGKIDTLSPMEAASIEGNVQAIKLLLDHGAKADDAMKTALGNRHSKLVKFLWEHGVRDIPELTYAISQGAPISDLQKLVGQGSPLTPSLDKIFSPLDIAAQMGNLDAVKLLIANGTDVNRSYVGNPDYPVFRRSALSMAASEGQDEVIAYLLSHGAKADFTSLHEAAENSTPYSEQRTKDHFEKSVRLLLDAGALKDLTPEEQGYIVSAPIETRQGPSNITVLKMILDAGGNPEAPMPYLADNGEKPNTIIGYVREKYGKLKADPADTSLAANAKLSLDLLEAEDKLNAPSDKMVRISSHVIQIGEDDYQAHQREIDTAVGKGDVAALNGLNLKSLHLVSNPTVVLKAGEQGVVEMVKVLHFASAFGKDSSGKQIETDFKTINLGTRLIFKPMVTGDKIDVNAHLKLLSLVGWTPTKDAPPQPDIHGRAYTGLILLQSGHSLGFPLDGGAQMESRDPTLIFTANNPPSPSQNPQILARDFLILSAELYSQDGKPAFSTPRSGTDFQPNVTNSVPVLKVAYVPGTDTNSAPNAPSKSPADPTSTAPAAVYHAEPSDKMWNGWGGSSPPNPNANQPTPAPEQFEIVQRNGEDPRTFSGKVVVEGPLDGVEVGLVSLVGVHWINKGAYQWQPINPDGTFSITDANYPDAPKAIAVRGPNIPWTFLRYNFSPTESAKNIMLKASPSKKVRLTARDANLQPLAHVGYEIFPAYAQVDDQGNPLRRQRLGTPQSEDATSLDVALPLGEVALLVHAKGFANYYQIVDTSKSDNIDLVMITAGRMKIIVTDLLGKPVVGVHVDWVNPAAPLSISGGNTDANGEISRDGLMPGTFQVHVSGLPPQAVKIDSGMETTVKVHQL